MAKYTVKSRVDHDGKTYEPGKTIDLGDEHAQALLDVKVIEPVADKKEKKAEG